MSAGSATGAGSARAAGKTGGAAPRRPARPNRQSAARLTLLLALLLLLIGVAGAGAMQLLLRAMRTPTADDVAQLVCTAYTTQSYDTLISIVDPTSVPPAQNGPFDSAAKASLTNTLKELDTGSGDVTSCSYKQLTFNNLAPTGSTLQYILTMRRANVTVDISMQIKLVRQPDGNWRVSRDSDFTGIPGHPTG